MRLNLSARVIIPAVCAVVLSFLPAWFFSQKAILAVEEADRTAALRSALRAEMQGDVLLTDIRQSLTTLAAVPGLLEDSGFCRETLEGVLRANPGFDSLEAAGVDGKTVCSTAPVAVPENSRLLASMSETGGFALEGMQPEGMDGEARLLAGAPVFDPGGEFAGGVIASVGAEWIGAIPGEIGLPEESHLMLLGEEGRILQSHPEAVRPGGGTFEIPVPQPATRGKAGMEAAKVTGADQIEREYDLFPLNGEGSLTLAVGTPVDESYSSLLEVRNLILSWQALITIFAVVCASAGYRLLIGNRIKRIITANQMLAEGDGSARTGIAYNTDEIGRLAQTFDRMAETLQSDRFILQNESAARIATEKRYQRLFRDAVFGIFQATPEGKLLDVNPAYARLFGYGSPEEILAAVPNVSTLYVYPEKRREIVEKMIRTRMPINLDNEYSRKDGSRFIGNLNSWAVFNHEDQIEMLEGSIEDITAQKESRDVITRQVEQLSSLRTIDLAIGTNLDLKVTLNIILEQATTHLHVDAACIYLFNPILRTLTYILGRGFQLGDYQLRQRAFSPDKSEMELLEEMSVRLPDVAAAGPDFEPPARFWEERFVAFISLPLVAKGQIKGVLEVFHRMPLVMNREWIDFLNNLAAQTAVAIDSSELLTNLKRSNSELRHAYDATIEGWSRALDLRDHETNDHTMRTADITVRLAQAFGISDADLIQIRWGALLHDIGKMAIPDSILNKPGPLTSEEWEVMKKHTVYARDMLAAIDFLQPAMEIPYCHHEKWNGEGYPRQLKGPVIPLAARIFSVVDVWDALRSDRPYRKAWPDDRIRTYIQEQTGSHFDPAVVEAFTNWLDESGDYRN